MKKHTVDIIPLERAFLDPVVRLHMAHLRTNYSGCAGRELLLRYYQTLSQASVACGFVAVDRRAVVAGFVCGVWNAAELRSELLKKHIRHLLVWGTLQILTQPSILNQFIMLISPLLNSSVNRQVLPQAGYELRPIVVSPDFRGTGVSNKLVDRLIRDANQRGFGHIFLYTEEHNTAANAFYRRVGFEHVNSYGVGQTVYLRYEISTSDSLS